MKLKPAQLVAPGIAVCVIAVVCLVQLRRIDLFERLERITYDLRVRAAQKLPAPVATNLGTVFISDDTVRRVQDGTLGEGPLRFHYGLYWPRHIYGRALRELTRQGARAVAFDILLGNRRWDQSSVPIAGDQRKRAEGFLRQIHPGQEPITISDRGQLVTYVESDDFFAWQLRQCNRGVLATEHGVPPADLFATNALAIGDISADSDSDGVLRRARAFQIYTNWHPAFKEAEAYRDELGNELGIVLSRARFEPGRIIFPRGTNEPVIFKVDEDNNFDLADFYGDNLPQGMPRRQKAFTLERVWHMGIVLAGQALGLDLDQVAVDLGQGKITLHGTNGLIRVIPVDANGYFYINWELHALDPRLKQEPFEKLLWQDELQSNGENVGTNLWHDRLVVIGSSTTGNDLTDHGATPLEKNTLLVSKHWNVANSIITGRFIHRTSPGTELALLAILGLLTALLTLRLPTFTAAAAVVLMAVVYCAVCFFLYIEYRYWLPLVLPVVGVMFLEQGVLVTYRVFFEEREKRRVKSIFTRIVSPNVVNELLEAERLGLGGARREVTVLFADVRGFTEFTDVSHERAEELVRQRELTGEAAETCFDDSARETLSTVNLYLACVADKVKQHDGTLDKYIGDCVMAFWGAPTPNTKHALACVRAAIDAQKAIHELNERRTEENSRLEIENQARTSAGLPPKPLHATLTLGTGINTGSVTVGLMGSEAHIVNYTVFGREVNLASRLEHESGRGRIVISEATYKQLLQDDPGLAATCVALEPVTVKGIRNAVKIYEVPWQAPITVKVTSF